MTRVVFELGRRELFLLLRLQMLILRIEGGENNWNAGEVRVAKGRCGIERRLKL